MTSQAGGSRININLPSINGEIEAGITVGVDASLPEERRLPILMSAGVPTTHGAIKACACIWAYRQFNDPDARKLLVNGVGGILDLGLVRIAGEIPDGDWRRVVAAEEYDQRTIDDVTSIMSIDEMKRAVTVAVATKANYWLMNHHTGQGAVAGYVKKVLDLFYRDRVSDQLVSAAHNLGHYTSSLGVLTIAGIDYIRVSIPITSNPDTTLVMSQDAKLRFQSMPAGTHRLAIGYEAAKRLIRSVYAAFCPGINEMHVIPAMKANVMAAPARYHIGASYLTGNPRANYQDTDMEQFLGRLGIFITTLYKNSTLAKSPHMSLARVESYEDYDAEFKRILIEFQTRGAAERAAVIREQLQGLVIPTQDEMAQLKALFSGN